MSFEIPNEGDAGHADQAEPDKVDFDILVAGIKANGVLSGCAVTAQGVPDMTVAVAVGEVLVAGVKATVVAGNVNITAADGADPRFSLITVNSAGAKACTDGIAAANPVFPAIPANSVVLAAIYVPANDLTIEAGQIIDKRVSVFPKYKIEDTDADTKVDTEESADEDKVRVDTGGVERLVIDSVGAEFVGNVGVGIAPNASYYLDVSPVIAAAQAKYLLRLNPSNPAFSANGTLIGVFGAPNAFGIAGGTHTIEGLNFTVGSAANNVACTFTAVNAAALKPSAFSAAAGGDLTITNMRGLYLPRPSLTEVTGGAISVTTYSCIDVVNPARTPIQTLYGLRIADCTAAAVANYILELGPTPFLRLLGSTDWAAMDNETPLYLAGDDPTVLHQITMGAADSGGAGFRCLRVPNL